MTDEPPKITKPQSQSKTKVKPKKPLLIRDLVKTEIRKNNQSATFESKKRKLTDDDDRCVYPFTWEPPDVD